MFPHRALASLLILLAPLASASSSAQPAATSDTSVMRYPPSSVRTGLITGGLGLTGTSYALSAISAAAWPDVPGAKALYVPIAGPWISLSQIGCSESNPDCGALLYVRGALLVLDGLAQIAGLGLIGEGIFMTTEADADPDTKSDPQSAAWSVAPMVTADQAGAALVGTF